MLSAILCDQAKQDASSMTRYAIEISVKDPKKIGDGVSAYMTYKVVTKVKSPENFDATLSILCNFIYTIAYLLVFIWNST